MSKYRILLPCRDVDSDLLTLMKVIVRPGSQSLHEPSALGTAEHFLAHLKLLAFSIQSEILDHDFLYEKGLQRCEFLYTVVDKGLPAQRRL